MGAKCGACGRTTRRTAATTLLLLGLTGCGIADPVREMLGLDARSGRDDPENLNVIYGSPDMFDPKPVVDTDAPPMMDDLPEPGSIYGDPATFDDPVVPGADTTKAKPKPKPGPKPNGASDKP